MGWHVFDFDKTLTSKDSIFGFYKSVHGEKGLYFPKRILMIVAGILYKLKLISNDQLKRLGVAFFLKGKTRDEVEKAGREYAQTIRLNNIYKNHFLKTPPNDRMIISASFEAYLKYLFPGEKVYGSKLAYTDSRVSGLSLNMYGKEKRVLLDALDREVEKCYSDSYSADIAMIEKASEALLIKGGRIIETHAKG